jgi:hypothetical protein
VLSAYPTLLNGTIQCSSGLGFEPTYRRLLSYLCSYRSLIATKHRVSAIAEDKVYGLIALWESEVQAEIVIDYNRKTAEVFTDAMKVGSKERESFNIVDL